MSENNSKSTHNDYCKFCGNKITEELSKKIKANKEDVVCESCGCQLLLITNISKEQNRGTELITDIEKEHQEEIREELKELYSFNIYSPDREKFGYYLTIFMSRSIYNIIKQYNLGLNITDIQIEMISNSIIREIINNRVDNEWLSEFKPIKKKFKKCYRELQSELSLNQTLQEVFLEFFRLLAKIIIKLINKKDYNDLQVIEYDIAEYLIKRDLFVSNIRFTVPFRYNLKICLSRLIYLRIKDIACKNNLKFRQLKLSNIEIRNISDEIIKYLTTHNEIINKFLGELEEIKLNDFNEFYEYLCLELKSDNLFAESFNYYLRWLIGHIHNMVSGKYKWRELSHFDRIIGSKLAQLINVEVDFEKIREFKENIQNRTVSELTVNSKGKQNFMTKESDIPNIHIRKFQGEVIKHIKKLDNLIECPREHKEIMLAKSEEILNRHISRAKSGEIIIPQQTRPLSNAAAIIYAVIVSTENMPKISGVKMGELIGVTKDVIPRLYRDLYKELARNLEFDFKGAQLGRSRKILSLYFFELLKNAELDLYKLNLHLEEIPISSIILRLRRIFIDEEKKISQKEKQLIEQLKEREIKQYKEMGSSYYKIFIKYFTDLANIIKLLIISNKSHKIIGADFFCQPFVRFLIKEKDINLFMTKKALHRAVREIYDYLKDSEYSTLFPARRKRSEMGETYWKTQRPSEYAHMVGSRIKIFIMKHIYNRKYFRNGLSLCLDCFREGKKLNISFPRLRAKSFHHEDETAKTANYRSGKLFRLFNKNRGNPYFLPDLINQMEREKVELKCRCHHRLKHSSNFFDFKKLISWEGIPREFPYDDIFDLPAEIIHILVMVCVDNFYKTKTKTTTEKKGWIDDIIILLKKRYFIDLLYGGICPICGEFNTKDHLTVFDYNHFYKKNELIPKGKEKGKRIKINDLFILPCSKIIKEMEKDYYKGAFICCNDHMVIHESSSGIDKIFDDKNMLRKVLEDNEDTIKRYKQSLIHNMKNKILIKDPLNLKGIKRRPLMKLLMTLFEISEEKGVVNTNDIMNNTKLSKSAVGYLFQVKREFLKNYGELIIGKGHTPTKYYMNDEGRRIIRLIYYFRDFYRNLKPEK